MSNTKPTTFTALRNAFAALIGYPSNLDGSLTPSPSRLNRTQVITMNDAKPTTLETLRNAIATLIGYPPKLGGLLRRRLGG